MFADSFFSQCKNRTFVFVSAILLLFSGVANSTHYVPPIGIPMPSFGIHETAPSLPSPWSSDVSGFYYVKTGGSNSGNGYPGNPRNAIPNSGLPAGAVVVIDGQYNTAHSQLILNGTSANPIYIISSVTDQAIIKQKWVVTGSYYIIDGVNAEWDNSSGNGKLLISGSYGVVKNGSYRGDTNKGVGSVSISNGDNIVFYNNSVSIAGDWQATEDQDTHAMGISTNISYLWVLDNSFSRSSGDGIQINAANTANQSNTHHIYIGRNTAFENKQNGFWTKQATDVIFSENVAYKHIPSGSSPGVGLGQQYGPENVWYLFNKVYGNYGGITIASRSGGVGENIYIIGNQIYNNNLNPNFDPGNSWANAGITITGGVNVAILNNVLANNSGGINTPIGSGEFLIYNNIIDTPVVAGANSIFFYESGLASSSFVDNNIFNETAVIRWGRSAQDNLSSFQSTFSQCENCEEANPQYVDSLNGDFTLQASSSAIDSGRVSDAYQVFQNLYGIDIRKDVAGLARPQGSGWDMGAFEYNSNILTAPSVLSATVISSSQINLSWIDNSNNEDGFTLQYSTDGGSSYIELVSLSAGTTNYSQAGLSETTTYDYRLFSYNSFGNSAYSNSVSATTQSQIVSDIVVPILSLLGDNPQSIVIDSSYMELGANASDNIDGDISSNIVIDASLVNMAVVGSYNVTYNVTDAAGNAAIEKSRVVNVIISEEENISDTTSNGGALGGWGLLLMMGMFIAKISRRLNSKRIIEKCISEKFSFVGKRFLQFFGLVVLFFSASVNASPYLPPIGIPAPEFGINETVLSIYGSDTYFTHYVDNTAASATDADNPNGSPDKPRLTIPDTLAAGSVVEVRGGPYDSPTYITWQMNGTLSAPIFIRGVSAGSRVKIVGDSGNSPRLQLIFEGQYFIVENIDFYNKVTLAFDPSVTHGTLRGSEVHNPVNSTGALNPTVNAQGTHIVIYDNEIHDNVRAPEKDNHGVQGGAGGKQIWVLNNTIYNNGGNGFQACNRCNTNALGIPRFIYIGGNEFYGDKEVAIALKYAEDVIISENKIHDYLLANTTAMVSGIIIGADGYPERVWVLNNEIYKSIRGIRVEEVVDLWMMGNVIYDIERMAFNIEKTNPNTNIIGNTVWNADVFINQDRWVVPVLTVSNNIVVNMVGANNGNHMNIESSQVYTNATFSNNLFWQGGSDIVFNLGDGSSGPYSTFSSTADFNAETFGSNNIIADPLFVDSANKNFQLQSHSPAIDSGVLSNAYQTFNDVYGLDIRQDISKLARPQGNDWEIGAYEYDANLVGGPSKLIATAISANQIDLSWEDNSDNEDGFIIEYSTDSGVTYSELISLSANTTSYSQTGLSVVTAYHYRLFSYNGSGNSAYSNSVNAITLTVVDAVAPILTLVGDNPQEINVGESYVELGASATDDVDGDITANITMDTSAVDMSSVGSYTVTYHVSDTANNNANETIRVINVVSALPVTSTSEPDPTNSGALDVFLLMLLLVARFRRTLVTYSLFLAGMVKKNSSIHFS